MKWGLIFANQLSTPIILLPVHLIGNSKEQCPQFEEVLVLNGESRVGNLVKVKKRKTSWNARWPSEIQILAKFSY